MGRRSGACCASPVPPPAPRAAGYPWQTPPVWGWGGNEGRKSPDGCMVNGPVVRIGSFSHRACLLRVLPSRRSCPDGLAQGDLGGGGGGGPLKPGDGKAPHRQRQAWPPHDCHCGRCGNLVQGMSLFPLPRGFLLLAPARQSGQGQVRSTSFYTKYSQVK